MNDDVYLRLGERLNKNKFMIPLSGVALDFLKEIFTEEQAALGAEFPIGAHTLDALATILNRDQTQLGEMLETMADQGLIFVRKGKDQTKDYSLVPFAPGLVEFQTLRGDEDDTIRKRVHKTKAMFEKLFEMTGDLYKAGQNIEDKDTGLRTLSLEEKLPAQDTIYPYEQLSKIIESESSFAAGACHCRHEANLTGDGCKINNPPKFSCIYFGMVADFVVEREFAHRLTKEELIELLKDCREKGLVHNINNYLGPNTVICNCCGCCCHGLRTMKQYPGLNLFTSSNFVPVVDKENCTACEACVDICQLEAVSMEDEIVSIDKERCLGCGNCVSVCPYEALSMIRRSDYKPPERPSELVGLGI